MLGRLKRVAEQRLPDACSCDRCVARLRIEIAECGGDVRGIEMREISTLVNSVRNNGPELLEPVEPQPEHTTLL